MTATNSITSQDISEADLNDAKTRQLIFSAVYPKMNGIARNHLRSFQNISLSARDVVNEMYVKFVGASEVSPENLNHLYALFSRMMRQIILDHLRKKKLRIDGHEARALFGEALAGATSIELQAVIEATEKLEQQNTEMAQVVNLRFFAGLTEEECASVMQISERTVTRKWKMAKSWLYKHIET